MVEEKTHCSTRQVYDALLRAEKKFKDHEEGRVFFAEHLAKEALKLLKDDKEGREFAKELFYRLDIYFQGGGSSHNLARIVQLIVNRSTKK